MKRLRNLLEDVEDYVDRFVQPDSFDDALLDRVIKCKVILVGLHLNLQSFSCSPEKPHQSELVAAGKASVQLATDGLLVAFHSLSEAGRSKPSSKAHELSAAAEYRESPKPRKSSATTWQTPLKPPDPLSVDASFALASVTGPCSQTDSNSLEQSCTSYKRLAPPAVSIVPKKPEKPPHLKSPKTKSSTLENPSYGQCDRPRFLSSTTTQVNGDRTVRQRTGNDPHNTIYVPYRPWYSPVVPSQTAAISPNRTDSCAGLSCVKGTSLGSSPPDASTHQTSEIYPSDCTERRDDRVKAESSGDSNNADGIPPMPTRAPPVPPKPALARRKFSPRVPPRRRANRNTKPSSPRCSNSGNFQFTRIPLPDPYQNILPSSDPEVDVDEATTSFKRALIAMTSEPVRHTDRRLRRRASTGDLTIFNEKSHFMMTAKVKSCYKVSAMRSVSKLLEANKAPHHNLQPCILKSAVTLHRSRSLYDIDITMFYYHMKPSAASPKSEQKRTRPPRRGDPDYSTYFGEGCSSRTGSSSRTSSIPDSIQEVPDGSRIEKICASWKSREWAKVALYLEYHLSLIESPDSDDAARRVRFLLGICASYRGHWKGALGWFTSVVRTPVTNIRFLDSADRAAFYWLGDTYAIMGRREEALLAYCLAGSCDRSNGLSSSNRCLFADQQALQKTMARDSFRAIWASESFRKGKAPVGGILASAVVTQSAAQACLQDAASSPDRCDTHAVFERFLIMKPQSHGVALTPAHLQEGKPWPMPYDPTFSLDNVLRGRLAMAATTFDAHDTPASIKPRKSMTAERLHNFACADLPRLIASTRACLRALAHEWTETQQKQGKVLFLARSDVERDNVVAPEYFTLEIIRPRLRAGYALAYRPGSLCRARGIFALLSGDDAVEKRLKARLRETIESVHERLQQQQQQQQDGPAPRASQDDSTSSSSTYSRRPSLPPRPLASHPTSMSDDDSSRKDSKADENANANDTPSSLHNRCSPPPPGLAGSRSSSALPPLPPRPRVRMSMWAEKLWHSKRR